MQARVGVEDYASVEAFAALVGRLGGRVEAAIGAAPRGRPALVVFPEMFGTFLGIAAHPGAARAKTTDGAMGRVALSRAPALLAWILRHRVGPKTALLGMLGGFVRDAWTGAMSPLAKRLGAHVVAGSALLPDPKDPRRVRNVSLLFGPDGRELGETEKCNLVPTQEDVLGLAPGAPGDVRATDLGGGARAATLICYDGFRIAHTDREPGFTPMAPFLDRLAVDVIAHPSANPWAWDAGWVFADPGERLLRRDQWRVEGMASTLAGMAHTRWAVTAHLTGGVLDNHFEGRSQILERTAGSVAPIAEARTIDSEEIVHARVAIGP